MAALVQAITRHTATRTFLQPLYAVTEGNPFFVEETLRMLAARDQPGSDAEHWTKEPLSELRLPRSVTLAVQRRLQQVRGGKDSQEAGQIEMVFVQHASLCACLFIR